MEEKIDSNSRRPSIRLPRSTRFLSRMAVIIIRKQLLGLVLGERTGL
jgi:hypothetical protein